MVWRMGLEEMLRAIEEEASSRYERIQRRAAGEAREILAGANAQRHPLLREALAKAQFTLASERARRLTRARFSVQRESIVTKQALADEAFASARSRLGEVRQRPEYPAIFMELAREALEGVAGRICIQVDARDAPLAASVLRELGFQGELVTEFVTAGGLRVEVDGGRIVSDNTLEARLAKAERSLRSEVVKCLFG
jgi:vacuolar-type H+-ATPase subunit E/Vma4